MIIKPSQTKRFAFVAVCTIVVLIPLLLNQTIGPDFEEYFMWAKAFNQGNIFCLEENILSPQGVPLSQWSFGPGLIFSLGRLFSSIRPNDAIVVGWLFAVIFWVSYVGILLRVTYNNHSLALFGACITFIGTPIGFYSSAYASETLSYACLSVLIYWILSRDRFSVLDFLVVGIWTSLLVIIRSQLALYVVPVYLVILYRIRSEVTSGGISIPRSILRGVISHVPVLLALLATLTVNYWMTGSPFESVYNFGYGEFKSMDFLHPELLAVLVHPWHGLFVYHPLYLIGFAALFAMICKQLSSAMVIFQFKGFAAKLICHPCRQANFPVWQQSSPS